MNLESGHQQNYLFSEAQMRGFARPPAPLESELTINQEFLENWKAKIADYQNQMRTTPIARQTSLFEPFPAAAHADTIEPFCLELQNFFFFRWCSDRNPNDPCIYFVLDTAVPLLLYIGETCNTNQRWTGYHDCKRYVLNYQNLHFTYQIRTTINIAFWWETPHEVRPRQHLESALIAKWKAPFNKENWEAWGTPFVYRNVPN
jgi:hypothetical protein